MSEQSNKRQLIIDVVALPLNDPQPACPPGAGEAHTINPEQAEDAPKTGRERASVGSAPRRAYYQRTQRSVMPDSFFFIYHMNGRITGAFHAPARIILIVLVILSLAIIGISHTNLFEVLGTVVKTFAR